MQFHIGLFGMLIIYGMTVESHDRLHVTEDDDLGKTVPIRRSLQLLYADGLLMSDINLDAYIGPEYDTIEHVQVRGGIGRGPLMALPQSICRFRQLKHLDLSNNHINDSSIDPPSSCFPQLQTLNLSNNFLSEIPVQWTSQMLYLQELDLAYNFIRWIPAETFASVTNMKKLDVSYNKLTAFELWLIQIDDLIDYSGNPLTGFTNRYSMSLSRYQSNITQQILMRNTGTMIDFDDGLLEMYDRCGEINGTNSPIVMETIRRIHDNNRGLLLWNCSCKQYHLQKYLFINEPHIDFSTWQCSHKDNTTYELKCHCRSSFNPEHVTPRLCRIEDELVGTACNANASDSNSFLCNVTRLEMIAPRMYDELMTINLTSTEMASKFADRINQFTSKLEELAAFQEVTRSIRIDLQNITTKIEALLESIRVPMSFTLDSIAILSVSADSSVYSFSQIKGPNASFSYSIGIDATDASTSITISRESTENLSFTDVYTFYYLPSSLFQHAQNNRRKVIVSPIVGVHLPNRAPRLINMSFTHTAQISGSYSCEFWQVGDWNDTGCYHWSGSTPTRHFCFCNHTTSFALLFLPDKPIHQAYIPSITVAILSIVCFVSSIILSIRQQSTSFRHLSIANIFTLLNSIVLFALLTVILVHGYQSSKRQTTTDESCGTMERRLAIAIYFFLISTFASKTLLGICYFLAIFAHFVFLQFTSLSSKWLYISFVLVIVVALIPTIIVQQGPKLFVRYEAICWLDTSAVFRFVSIPVLIFTALNLLTILAITTRLCQFVLSRTKAQTSEKRLSISLLIWLSLCISLGVAWMVGPFLSLITAENNGSAAILIQWIFGLFIGLEGVWVLIVNVVFYVNQKRNTKKRPMILNKLKKSDF